MNRRRFLWRVGLVSVVLNSVCALLFDNRSILKTWRSYSGLSEDIQALCHRNFIKAFPDLTLEDLIEKLQDRGILSWRGLSIDRIRRNAVSEQLIEFDKFFWTESELLLYAVIARLHATEIMNDVSKSASALSCCRTPGP